MLFEISKDPDVLAYDRLPSLLYVAGQSGIVLHFKVSIVGVIKIGEGLIGSNAHTMAVDSSSHDVCCALNSGRAVRRLMRPVQ